MHPDKQVLVAQLARTELQPPVGDDLITLPEMQSPGQYREGCDIVDDERKLRAVALYQAHLLARIYRAIPPQALQQFGQGERIMIGKWLEQFVG